MATPKQAKQKVGLKGTRESLHRVLEDHIPKQVVSFKNSAKSWKYGYDEKYDMVVISKTGQIGEIYEIQNLKIALPKQPAKIHKRADNKAAQYWEPAEYPSQLSKIKSTASWNRKSPEFKNRWVGYIEKQFDYRERGYWFMNNGEPTYITGTHWMYIQWAKIDVGLPDYRYANRILQLHWAACVADNRSYGQNYLKIRRSGFSFMASNECVDAGTLAINARIGILSKTGDDAKKMFTDKVVPINTHLPFFFKPIMDGMDKPKTELSYRVPASKITKKNMNDEDDEKEEEGLNTSIDWNTTNENSYDGEKLYRLIQDEAFKWEKPNSILGSWRVTKTCLRLGRKIIGKCMMGSTSNALAKGGANGKALYYDSDVVQRNKNGQTKSGLYSLFIPMEFNMEGFIDIYGNPVLHNPKAPVMGIDKLPITQGAIEYWENEVESLKHDPDGLNEYYRQYPRTEAHAFRDESKSSLFNLTKIYEQIDYNDAMIAGQNVTQGNFSWENGIKDTKVIFTPNNRGRFYVSWVPSRNLQNNVVMRNGKKYPGNEHIGAFGCDSYDISGTVGGGGSNAALHGLTKFNMEEAPSNAFFLEYIARPQTAEIMFEDVLMAIHFYGMPILVENNKPRLLYHLKHRGYRKFAMNRPDKVFNKLSKTERELGGIPNSSEDVKQAHAAAIESYIDKYVGILEGQDGEMGDMPFNRTLTDWARFDISNRTAHDASISSGLAGMAVNRHLYQPKKEESRIIVNFATYSQSGNTSQLIK